MTKKPFMIWIRGEASEAKNHAILQIPETIHRWRVFFKFTVRHFPGLNTCLSLMQFIPKSFMFLMFIQFHSANKELIDFLKELHSDAV